MNQNIKRENARRAHTSRGLIKALHLVLMVVSVFAYLTQQQFSIVGFDRKAASTRVVLLAFVVGWPFLVSWVMIRSADFGSRVRSSSYTVVLLVGSVVAVTTYLGGFGDLNWWKVAACTVLQAIAYAIAAVAILRPLSTESIPTDSS